MGFEYNAARLSPEDTRLKCRTVEGELPKVRSRPRGCFGALEMRRAVGVAPEGTRMAVATEDLDDVGRLRPVTGESETLPKGAELRSIRCMTDAQPVESSEGMRAALRRLVAWGVAVFLMVPGWIVKFHSSSSFFGDRSTMVSS